MIGDHPRQTLALAGHRAAEQALLEAALSGRMHHGWLLGGPKGIGKATLAYRFARFLLAGGAEATAAGPSLFGDAPAPPTDLSVDPDHPAVARIAAGGHGNLVTVERGFDDKRKVRRSEIVVDDIRRLARHFETTAAEPGWRIAIIDSADEMNRSAANALLKMLEEPPADCLLMLVAHRPGGLLPTIRSRCRKLMLTPPDPDAVAGLLADALPETGPDDRAALAVLAGGAPGRALSLAGADGLALYDSLLAALAPLPKLDGVAVHALAGQLAPKAAEDRFTLFADLLLDWTAGLVRQAAGDPRVVAVRPGEAETRARLLSLAPGRAWLALWDSAGRLLRRGSAVNLDRKQLVLSLFDAYQAVASGRPVPFQV